MFKFNIPITIILSSGSLILLAVGSFLFVGNTAYTSDVQALPEIQAINTPQVRPNLAPIEQVAAEVRNVSSFDSRRRNGRLYSQSGYGGQQQASMDSYAAAYAAANSPSASGDDHSPDMVQSSVQPNDAGSYASSFGEAPPNVASSSLGSAARQLPNSDYSPHSSYYSGYMSPSSQSASQFGGQIASDSKHHVHHYPHYPNSLPLGYPTSKYDHGLSNYYDRSYLGTSAMPLWPSGHGAGGLMSSASTALSSWAGGFSVGEIICGLVALSIGAVILGAPFFLIYLALMGNFSGSGTLSLTNPTGAATPAGAATTTVNGRRKRLAIFEQLSSSINQRRPSEFGALADVVVNQLSPFVDLQQVTTTFKRLVDSINKYSKMGPEVAAKKKSA